jgi:23S rRNA (guanosine2251-2'-O)-methyltransferase
MNIILIAYNLRSTHNVGSLLRTAEGLGVECVYLSGYTPYPVIINDTRLPHIAQKLTKQITKTSLGAETSLRWEHVEDVYEVIEQLRRQGYTIAALEQSSTSIKLPDWQEDRDIALIVGREVEGVEPEILSVCDAVIEIPMFGAKESYNVSVAAGMALYKLKFMRS